MGCVEGVAPVVFSEPRHPQVAQQLCSFSTMKSLKCCLMDNRRQSRDQSTVVVQVEHVLRYTIPPDLLFGICFVFCSTLAAAVLFFNEVKEGKTQTTGN